MEFLPLQSLLSIITVILSLSLFICNSQLWRSRSSFANEKRTLPPQPGNAWPLIGHLHLFHGSKQDPIHVIFGNMADDLGPIFLIKLGVHRILVISNWEMAKQCFTTNDKVFSNRPNFLGLEIMGYNYAMFGFGPYGPYWRQMRKITTFELLSNLRLVKLKHVLESELKSSMEDMYQLWLEKKSSSNQVSMEMTKWFADTINLNVIFRMVVGKPHAGSADGWPKALQAFLDLAGTFSVSEALPMLRWLDMGGFVKAMERTAKEIDNFLSEWLEQHKQNRINFNSDDEHSEKDFMDVMLSVLDKEQISSYDVDTIIKATSLTVMAGTNSTTITLSWALSLLLNNRNTLKKAQEELDLQVGRGRSVQESDLKKLVYLQAIIKETMRLHPAAPLAPHESMEDCKMGGYHVPAGTRVLINIPKIQRDPSVWPDPLEFRPERFLTTHKDVDVGGQHFELLPFGSGRRVCPGVSFSLQIIQLVLATLLHGFEIETPFDEAVDMTEKPGLVIPRAAPLEVLLKPRLHPCCYSI
ncbi:cytochrome P450 CYP82D47 [Ziziphus jujuba]|uniref:Cytochrome P450 CYP82D47 n=1 Tax=Ziziphus jujuba TaxID=326968 RepID=A0ABM4A8K0_ZIZJJ|nr:cytochrome P450 CYP82D47 [Ziziphus jujuba]